MDAKALAKSKRAHTQHHSKKSHHIHKTKAQSGSAQSPSSANKPSGSQVGDKTRESRRLAALPSNWDRYDDGEYDSGYDDPSRQRTSQPSDVILPKSKGADFRHIVAEARAEYESKLNRHPTSFHSFDDVLADEFSEALGCMLSARGEGILSWMGDENFVIEDERTPHQEAPFLSLNLHALAKQLEEVELCRRLFIEEDLLPPDLRSEPESSGQESIDFKTTRGTAGLQKASQDSAAKLDFADERTQSTSLVPRGNPVGQASSMSSSDQTSTAEDRVRFKTSLSRSEGSSKEDVLDTVLEISSKPDATSKKKCSGFEASSAEAELDMLLGSFEEIKLHESPAAQTSSYIFSDIEKESSKPLQVRSSGQQAVQPHRGAAFDDVLDDLLDETSIQLNHEAAPARPNGDQTSSSQSVRKSMLLEDFDSWLDTM